MTKQATAPLVVTSRLLVEDADVITLLSVSGVCSNTVVVHVHAFVCIYINTKKIFGMCISDMTSFPLRSYKGRCK